MEPVISLGPGDDLKLVVGLGVVDLHVGTHRYRAHYEDGDGLAEALGTVQDELTAGRAVTDLNAFLEPLVGRKPFAEVPPSWLRRKFMSR
ncbi:hypothetical protein [Actinoplanes sp. NPDC048796]|uniref:hypothetical protein n=1 Tax=unclassified Actinoplanes TaxID=2626549 RepID=UPI0033F77B2D